MVQILTITMNPAIDISTAVERVMPIRKLRCTTARRYPGGGGINVARVASSRRHGDGTLPSRRSCRSIDAEGLRTLGIPVEGETREKPNRSRDYDQRAVPLYSAGPSPAGK